MPKASGEKVVTKKTPSRKRATKTASKKVTAKTVTKKTATKRVSARKAPVRTVPVVSKTSATTKRASSVAFSIALVVASVCIFGVSYVIGVSDTGEIDVATTISNRVEQEIAQNGEGSAALKALAAPKSTKPNGGLVGRGNKETEQQKRAQVAKPTKVASSTASSTADSTNPTTPESAEQTATTTPSEPPVSTTTATTTSSSTTSN